LREWVTLPASAEEIAARLTARGLAVDAIVRLGHDFPNVVVGHVLEVRRHPDADKLSLCRVDAGGGQVLSVVCGAPNVHAGMKAPLALVGAELPGGLRIKRSKIRGEASEGMLCSSRELGMGDDHSGILSFAADAAVGRPVRELFGEPDALLEIDIAYNRPDLLCIAGLAREVAAAFDLALEPRPAARSPSASRTPRAARATWRRSSAASASGRRRRGWPSGSSARECVPSTTWSTSPTTCFSRWGTRSTPSTSRSSRAPRSWCAAPARASPSPRSTAARAS
jgi:tRNA-binding EMAP/Myf-like protein